MQQEADAHQIANRDYSPEDDAFERKHVVEENAFGEVKEVEEAVEHFRVKCEHQQKCANAAENDGSAVPEAHIG